MAYNHGKAARKWKLWKEKEEKILIDSGVSEDIMKGENIGEEEKEFISIIAILHDIGAVEAQKKYGSIDGVYQEKDGPEVAKEI